MSIEKWLEMYGVEEEAPQDEDVEQEETPEDEPEQEDIQEQDHEPEQESEEYEEEPVQEEQKRKQSREENARFAEQRRQQQLEQTVQDRLRQSKEYQTSKLLAEMYGVPESELYDKLYEAKLAQEAKKQNVPVEFVRERDELRKQQEELQEQIQNIKFQQWQARIDGEKAELKRQFNNLTDTDLDDAAFYMLDTLGRTDLPLQQAVFALHGHKLLGTLKEVAKNEALAEVSGRKKSPLPAGVGKAPDSAPSLTNEERYIAKKLGLTDKEYSKWKEGN